VDEVVVSAQTSGQLERFDAREGAQLRAGDTVAWVDTAQLAIERLQLEAQRRALAAQRGEVDRQGAALRAQREVAQRAFDRTTRLAAGGAATATQRDAAERDLRTLSEQARGAAFGLERVGAEREALDARLASVRDRLRRARVTNPVRGTVLATYVHAGEVIQPGQPLYRVANLDTLELRAYLTGDQLASVTIGQDVTVRTDSLGGALSARRGVVSWISPRAEFTPTPVQTRDDRTDLVYAIRIRVPNGDGRLKIGMPADVTIAGAGTAP
jgi:HlyD family secretion protein